LEGEFVTFEMIARKICRKYEVDDGLLKIAGSNYYGQPMMGLWMGPITSGMVGIMTTMDLGEWHRRDRYCPSQ
jgi:hypothetical protein